MSWHLPTLQVLGPMSSLQRGRLWHPTQTIETVEKMPLFLTGQGGQGLHL